MKKILYITTISGFLPQFEKNDVEIMQNMGYEIHYASNLKKPIYTFDEKELKQQGIILHQIDIEKSPAQIIMNCRAIKQLIKIIDEEINDIKEMKPEAWENDVTFETRKGYYLSEAKAIRLKICNELK